ncbi:hypothetical protein [Nonomuraea solani]|uniref:hypothetical protein n=1 Tax=Nonomuraea solani TaxID=1144553 RepID=UPI00190F038C|nr:hypothetical protein [Nonomuraea solani]
MAGHPGCHPVIVGCSLDTYSVIVELASSINFKGRRFVKRFFTIAMLAAATCLTLTVNAAPASADTVHSYYPNSKACYKAAKTLNALNFLGKKKYYCSSNPRLAVYKVMRVTK